MGAEQLFVSTRLVIGGCCAACLLIGSAAAQLPVVRSGDPVPRDVRELYDAGCRYLVTSQEPSGSWKDAQEGPGVTGMAMMVLLASGEDPNHGAYRPQIRRAIRSIIASQDAASGFYGSSKQGHSSMYQHGFAMLRFLHVNKVCDDHASQITQAQLPSDGSCRL